MDKMRQPGTPRAMQLFVGFCRGKLSHAELQSSHNKSFLYIKHTVTQRLGPANDAKEEQYP